MSDERDLTTGPVWRALARLAVPMIFGIVAVISIAVADTYFVGRLGTQPLAALSFTFPVTMTVASFAIGLGAGAASVVSRAVGGGGRNQARRLATDSLLLAVITVAAICIVGLLTIRPLFSLLGAEGVVLDLIERYMRIWYASMPFLVVPMVANAVIRSVGDAFWPSVIMIGAALVNIVATPVLVFGLFGLPALGIEGAAWGTLVARALTLVFALYIVAARERLLIMKVPARDEIMDSWKRVLHVGLPAGVGSMINPVGIAIVTAILATYGDVTVAAFGVATRIESFAAIPMLALSSAIGPVAGQNWGAGQCDRSRKALGIAFSVCIAWAVVLAVIFWVGGRFFAGLLASEDAVAEEAARYLRIVPLSLFGYGVVIVAAGAYNALGKPIAGLGYYLVRTALLYVPLSFAASLLSESEAVYYGIAVANAVGGIVVGTLSLRWLLRLERRAEHPEHREPAQAPA